MKNNQHPSINKNFSTNEFLVLILTVLSFIFLLSLTYELIEQINTLNQQIQQYTDTLHNLQKQYNQIIEQLTEKDLQLQILENKISAQSNITDNNLLPTSNNTAKIYIKNIGVITLLGFFSGIILYSALPTALSCKVFLVKILPGLANSLITPPTSSHDLMKTLTKTLYVNVDHSNNFTWLAEFISPTELKILFKSVELTSNNYEIASEVFQKIVAG